MLVSVEAPLWLFDAVNFLGCGERVPRTILAEAAPEPQAVNFLGGGARRLRQRTYPLTLALESNVLDDFLITFPWSSASP